METIKMRPDSSLKSYWIVSWFIWYVFLVFIALLPAIILAIVGERGPGTLIAGIMIAAWSVVMFPILIWLPALPLKIKNSHFLSESLAGSRR